LLIYASKFNILLLRYGSTSFGKKFSFYFHFYEFSFYFYFRLRTAEETKKKKESRIILDTKRQQSCSAVLTNFLKSFSLHSMYFIFAKCCLWVNILRDPSVQYCTGKCLICFSLITGFPCRPYTIT
jgi:hypothetical protein